MFDLIVKGGVVIDPAQGIHEPRDVAISQGRIEALERDIPPSEAKKVIEVKNKIVTPGLIDLHVHCAYIITDLCGPPDAFGVYTGVTTVVDAGSTGYANFPSLRKFVIPQAQSDVLCLLNICATGGATEPENWGSRAIDLEKTLQTVEENREIIKGIKVRLIGEAVEEVGIEHVKAAKKVAVEAGLPLMIHIALEPWEEDFSEGKFDAYVREVLPLLEKGDIITHIYAPRGAVCKSDGSVIEGLQEAIKRGVYLDLGGAIIEFNFQVAKKALEKGILPHTISTDFSRFNLFSPIVYRVPELMSRFMAMGLSLEQVIEMTTINPARALGEEERRGSLKIGLPADITIMEVAEGDFVFYDRREKEFGNDFFYFVKQEKEERDSVKGKVRLVPRLTIKSGKVIEADSSLCRL